MNCFSYLSFDTLELIEAELGIVDALNFRQVSVTLSKIVLSSGTDLALHVLKTGPSIPLSMCKKQRRLPPFLYTNGYKLGATPNWRVEWACVMERVDKVGITVLIDTYLLLKECNKRRESTLVIVAAGTFWNAIHSRFFDLCSGVDNGVTMQRKDIVPTITRGFDDVGIPNTTAAFATAHKMYKYRYTPFMVAAELQNFELVKYLAKRPDTNPFRKTRGGNNAYALSKNMAQWNGDSAISIRESPLLNFLRVLGIVVESHKTDNRGDANFLQYYDS